MGANAPPCALKFEVTLGLVETVALRALNSRLFRPRRRDVVILGAGFAPWTPYLAKDSALWNGMDGVRSTKLVPDHWRPLSNERWLAARGRLIIPMLETNIATAPRACWGLFPSAGALDTLRDKAKFAQYAQRTDLRELVPRTYPSIETVEFPCVLKRTDLAGGNGITLAASAAALSACLSSPLWAGQPVIVQRYLAGQEWTAHVVAVNGRVLWNCAFAHRHDPDNPIRVPSPYEQTIPTVLSPRDIEDIERFLVPLDYDGPANIDFKRAADGRLQILEINPRLGGSLFRSQNGAALKAAFEAIVRHAKWRGGLPPGLDSRARTPIATEVSA